jgi:hypothetical protein
LVDEVAERALQFQDFGGEGGGGFEGAGEILPLFLEQMLALRPIPIVTFGTAI